MDALEARRRERLLKLTCALLRSLSPDQITPIGQSSADRFSFARAPLRTFSFRAVISEISLQKVAIHCTPQLNFGPSRVEHGNLKLAQTSWIGNYVHGCDFPLDEGEAKYTIYMSARGPNQILYIAMTNVWNRLNVTTRQVAGEWAKSDEAREWRKGREKQVAAD